MHLRMRSEVAGVDTSISPSCLPFCWFNKIHLFPLFVVLFVAFSHTGYKANASFRFFFFFVCVFSSQSGLSPSTQGKKKDRDAASWLEFVQTFPQSSKEVGQMLIA